MTSLLDTMAKHAEEANAKREATVAATQTHLAFDSDSQCPECGNTMRSTSVAGPLPAKVCFDCRICLPSSE